MLKELADIITLLAQAGGSQAFAVACPKQASPGGRGVGRLIPTPPQRASLSPPHQHTRTQLQRFTLYFREKAFQIWPLKNLSGQV